jgi:hypothetical protein
MKKMYLLMLLFISSTVIGQTPIITMIMDGDCSGGNPKVLEIYAQGTVDFTNYSLENQTNANTTWGNTFDLSPIGTVTNEFVYIHSTDVSFATEFPSVTNALSTTSSVISINGDDRIRIIETATSTLVDEYGVDGVDGTGEVWEYQDGYAKRNNNTGPDGTFVPGNWSFFNGAVNGLGLCQGGTNSFETISDAGSFTFATGPTISTSASTVSGFLQFLGNPSGEQTVDVSGTNLTADVEVTVATGDYEISLTTGSGFGPSVTLPFGTGTLAATPVYIRLNGAAVADPSNGSLLITSTGATDVNVVLEGEISAPIPTVNVSETTITGFSHFVGTPSAADSFNVAGFFLTADINIAAPTNFEISTALAGTYGPSITIPFGTGTVASTKVYVRLNGPAMNLAQSGDIVVSTTDAVDKNVALEGETLDYIVSTIGAINGVDANGVATSVGDYVILTGVVHCDDFRNNGYDLTVIDDNNDGITLFNFTDVDGYSPTEGDKIIVKGQIAQFNGLLQISPVQITVDAQGATLQTPTSVNDLTEATENQYIKMDSVVLVNGETQWVGNTSYDVTDGTTTVSVRVTNDSPLAGTAIPNGPIEITGVGKQYDSSSPFDSGYQLFPCGVVSLCNVDASTSLTDATITATSTATGLTYEWVNCADTSVIAGETGASFTATVSGNYAVIVTEGPCFEMSACVSVNIAGLSDNDFAGVSVYPNPVNEVLNITNENGILESVEVVTATGSIVYTSTVSSSNFTVNTASLNAGVYFVNVRTANSVKTYKVIK